MHNPVREKCPMISITESLRILVNISQYKNKNLLDYVKQFKQTRDVVKIHLGTEFLRNFVNNQYYYQT